MNTKVTLAGVELNQRYPELQIIYMTEDASKNGNSYGVLIEEAGSEKLSLTLTNNSIYKELKDMQETITNLQSQLSTEQDRYISQFTQMERLINQMNSQSSYLSQLGG